MAATILHTKLYMPPVRPVLVPRLRLIDQLKAGWYGKATIVIGPAGFGKTTLVSAWLNQMAKSSPMKDKPPETSLHPSSFILHPSHVAWLSLDENDNDLQQFLMYLVLALQTVDDQLGETATALLDTLQMIDAEPVLTSILNEVAAWPGRITLVLDDYHVIRLAAIHQAVSFLLVNVPPQLHLVFTSREELPLPLARWRMRGMLTEMGIQQLRFTHEEAADFLNQVMGLNLTRETIGAVEARTEGWVAGLQMAALSLRKKQHALDLAAAVNNFSAKNRYVIDYLAEEVMQQQPDPIRHFLRQTAICDRFCAALCNTLTGQNDSQAMLYRLEQANLFLIPLDDVREWYRYHALFADFLRTQLTPEQQRVLHQQASEWFEAQQLITEAIQHALAANNLSAATRLILQNAEPLINEGRFTLLLEWINTMPDEAVRRHSVLAARKAYFLYLRGQYPAAERYSAYSQAAPPPDDPLQQAEIYTYRAEFAYTLHKHETARALAQRALKLLADSDSIFHTYALNILGEAQLALNALEEAAVTFRQALALAQHRGHDYMVILSFSFLAPLLYVQGRRLEALGLCRQAMADYADRRGQARLITGRLHVSLGILHYVGNNLGRARHHLEIGIDLCQKLGLVFQMLIGQRTLARLQFVQGQTQAAWATLQAGRQVAATLPNPADAQEIDVIAANLHLRHGEIAAAERLLDRVSPSRQAQLARARLLLAQGQTLAAQDILDSLAHTFQQKGRLSQLITVRILQALAAPDRAAAYLPEAIRLAAPGQYQRHFLDEDPRLAALLCDYQALAPDFIKHLLQAFGTTPTPPPPPQPQPAAIDALGEREIEILRLVAEGYPNRQIAEKLYISLSTTKWYLNGIYQKLHVRNRTQAVAKARSLKLL
ncbi:MAG: hypothetical protein H6631_07125 [Anaerolineaceae bacterium]|nr:hypothetical protein [Anaerolineaceae bacterium]MCB9097911.1 hypothetical protein [Anaerolineales bacterium]